MSRSRTSNEKRAKWFSEARADRRKAIEASNSAEVKPESKSAAAEAGIQQTNNAIALLMEIVECAKNDKSVDTWLLSNYKRVNAVVAQQH